MPADERNTLMHLKNKLATGLLTFGALTAGLTTAAVTSSATPFNPGTAASASAPTAKLHLTSSSPALAKCMRKAGVNIHVKLTTDQVGFDHFEVTAGGLPPKTPFTVFLLQQADAPFGAAEYIGDITSNSQGRAEDEFKLIVQEGFSSVLVNGQRIRTDLNQVGMWFADPAGDDFCFGKGKGAVTPFDGDNEAGVQAFNSLNSTPLPAP
jgi:hypothetical protein